MKIKQKKQRRIRGIKDYEQFDADLMKVRNKSMTYNNFCKKYNNYFVAMSNIFFHMTSVNGLDSSDLKQEAMMEVWRRIGMWEPNKVSIGVYVNYCAFEIMARRINKFKGWPRKDRSPVMIQIDRDIASLNLCANLKDESNKEPDFKFEVKEIVSRVKDRFSREVLLGRVMGYSLKEIAKIIYSEKSRCRLYELKSEDDTYQKVRNSVKCLRENIEKTNFEKYNLNF